MSRDLDWAKALAAGDAEAWARFRREAGPPVRRALGPSEDVLQELCARLCEDGGRRLKGFRGEASLLTWAVVVALRLSRERSGRERAVRSAERARPSPRFTEAPVSREDVESALSTLPPEDRLLLRLIYWDGATLAEASAILAIPANTLSPRLTEIRRGLKRLLESEK